MLLWNEETRHVSYEISASAAASAHFVTDGCFDSAAQEELVTKYYRGYIPHVVVLNRDGRPVYNASGEVDEKEISKLLDGMVR